jgi:hypothetical protein
MATQTRRTTRRSARFFRATIKAHVVVACCGLVLLSVVAASAELPLNGLPINGIPLNGVPLNGMPLNGMPIQGLPLNGMPFNAVPSNGIPIQGMPMNGLPTKEGSLPTAQSESLPWSTLSQQGVGKSTP